MSKTASQELLVLQNELAGLSGNNNGEKTNIRENSFSGNNESNLLENIGIKDDQLDMNLHNQINKHVHVKEDEISFLQTSSKENENEFQQKIKGLQKLLKVSKTIGVNKKELQKRARDMENTLTQIKKEENQNKQKIKNDLSLLENSKTKLKVLKKKLSNSHKRKSALLSTLRSNTNTIEKFLNSDEISKRKKLQTLKKINKEVSSLKRIKKIEKSLKAKVEKVNKQKSLLETLSEMDEYSYGKKFNEYYNKISHELGIEVRSLNEIAEAENLVQKGSTLSKAAKKGMSLNKHINELRKKVLNNIEKSKGLTYKTGFNKEIMALVQDHKELKYLINKSVQKNNDVVRDYRARAIKILRKYNKDKYLLQKKKILKKNQINLLKSFEKFEVTLHEIDRLKARISKLHPSSAKEIMENKNVKALDKISKHLASEKVKIKNILGKKSLKGIEMIAHDGLGEIKELSEIVKKSEKEEQNSKKEKEKKLEKANKEIKENKEKYQKAAKSVLELKKKISDLKKKNSDLKQKQVIITKKIQEKLNKKWKP